jgi:hypothetical protein
MCFHDFIVFVQYKQIHASAFISFFTFIAMKVGADATVP